MSKLTYFYEDFSVKDLNESLVGRKSMSLFKLKDIDVPVPPFFAVSPLAFDNLIYKAFGEDIEKYLKKQTAPDPIDVEKALLKADFSADIEEELFKMYAKLSGFNDAWVAVRSSVIYPENGNVLFSGLFTTEVNVRGFDEVLEAIKKVYASVFKDAVVSYARNHNIDLSQLKMSVVIQKMIQAEVSGVTYTKDLITQDESKLSIEAVFGLGDVIANAEITPDRYVLDKKDLSFVEKKVAPQEWMRIRMLNTKGKGGVEKINISSSWSHQQKLEDRFLQELAKICLLIEDSFGKSQNIEWVWESGKFWIIQNKFTYKPHTQQNAQQEFSNVLLNPILDVVRKQKEEEIRQEAEAVVCDDTKCEEKKEEKSEKDLAALNEKIAKLSGKFEELAKKKIVQEKKEIEKLTKGIGEEKEEMTESISKNLIKDNLKVKSFEFLASGIGVSSGSKIGQILYADSRNYKNLTVSKENIVILKETFPGYENVVFLAGGILMDWGGLSSDVSILCREFRIPAVFGIKNLSKLLPEGSFAKIDASAGSIYVYKQEEDIEYEIVGELRNERKDEIKEKIEKQEQKIQEDVCVSNIEVPKTATQIYISSKEILSVDKCVFEYANGLAYLDLELLMLNEKRHPLGFVGDGKMKEYTNLIAKKIDTIADVFASGELIVSLGNYRARDFAQLTTGRSFEKEEETRGVARYLQNSELTDLALKIVSKSRNVFKNKNVSLAFHSPLSRENMIAIKKRILGAGLRRSSSFKIYAIIENPSEVILISEIVSANIDGIIINTPALAKQMQGLYLYDEKAKYDLEANSVLRMLEDIKSRVKAEEAMILGLTENNTTLLKKYVELGVCGVIVDGKEFYNAKKIISEKETDIILSKFPA